MFNVNDLDIVFLSLFTLIIFILLFNEYLIIRKSGDALVKRKNLLLVVSVSIIVALLIGVLDYYDSYMLNISDIMHIAMIVFFSVQITSICSSKFYRICENGVHTGLTVFFKWADIAGYEWKNDILKISTYKGCNICKLKVESENIQKVEGILEKNMILPII